MKFNRSSASNFQLSLTILAICFFIASASAQDATSRIQKVAQANSLDLPGKTPFHLKMSFQLYDLDGKPSDSGVVERWWAATGGSKTMIEAASLKSPEAVPFDGTLKIDPRERYFVQNLLDEEIHPIPHLLPATESALKETKRMFSTLELVCMAVPQGEVEGNGRYPRTFCVDPSSDVLRADFEGNLSRTARNRLGTFQGTHISFDLEIAFAERLAITGKLIALQSFDPLTSEVKLSTSVPGLSAANPGGGTITPGRKIDGPAPAYPSLAKAARVSGTVVVHAVITKQGTISDPFVIASPAPSLSEAAIDAVKHWVYKPFLLNGQPTSVETTINMNFNFAGS